MIVRNGVELIAGTVFIPSSSKLYFSNYDSYFELSDGDLVLNLATDKALKFNETLFEDLRVPVSATMVIGSNPPVPAKFVDDGVTGSGGALQFDSDNDEYIQIPSSASLNFDSGGGATAFSVGFMIQVQPGFKAKNLITKDGKKWEIKIKNDGKIQVKTDSGINETADNPINIGAVNIVVVTFNCTTTSHDVEIFVNNSSQGTDSKNSSLSDAEGIVYIGSKDGTKDFTDFDLDELRIWNSVLSPAELTSFYNGGACTETSIATEICGYHFTEGSGTDIDNFEGTAALDIDMTSSVDDPAWITGFISGASRGVFTKMYSPDIIQELDFTAQFSHTRKLGTDIRPHFHWAPTDTDTGTVRWGLEYTWADIDGTYGNTTTIFAESVAAGNKKHQTINFALIDGSAISAVTMSSMMIGRIFRDASHANDTYTGFAAFFEKDAHFEIDIVGSRQPFAK